MVCPVQNSKENATDNVTNAALRIAIASLHAPDSTHGDEHVQAWWICTTQLLLQLGSLGRSDTLLFHDGTQLLLQSALHGLHTHRS